MCAKKLKPINIVKHNEYVIFNETIFRIKRSFNK